MAQKTFVKGYGKGAIAAAEQRAQARQEQPMKGVKGVGGRKEPGGGPGASKKAVAPAPAPSQAKKGPPDPPPARVADSLPLASILPLQSEMDEVVGALEEYAAIQEIDAQHKVRKQELAAVLAGVCKARKLPGVRHGQLAAYYGGSKTRWSLNRGLLLENGVTPAQLKDSMKESAPFEDLRVLDLSKPKHGGVHGGAYEED